MDPDPVDDRTRPPAPKTIRVLVGLVVAAAVGTGCAGGEAGTPKGVVRLLPRGGIPAVFAPDFVSAEKAEIPDHAWVLGLVLDGEARAYSLNLLNGHEIVNDRVAGRPLAAVW